MYNPFSEIINENESDLRIINDVLEGDSAALEKLIYRHQAWIYNIALKMVFEPADAEDVTQEILIKIITHLSEYKPEKAAFRTWLYRIAANHVLNMKNKKKEIPASRTNLSEVFAAPLDSIEDSRRSNRPDYNYLIKETRYMCLTGMLLCLEKRQRLVFILGGIFNVPSSTGGEILDITEVNFRAILSRARKKLDNFMNERCGLIKPGNPCKCAGHVKKLVASGWLDPDNPQLSRVSMEKISSIAREKAKSVEGEMSGLMDLYRDSPFYDSPDFVIRMKELLGREEFRESLYLQ